MYEGLAVLRQDSFRLDNENLRAHLLVGGSTCSLQLGWKWRIQVRLTTVWFYAFFRHDLRPGAVGLPLIRTLFVLFVCVALAITWEDIWLLLFVFSVIAVQVGLLRTESSDANLDTLLPIDEILRNNIDPLLLDVVTVGKEPIRPLRNHKLKHMFPGLRLFWRCKAKSAFGRFLHDFCLFDYFRDILLNELRIYSRMLTRK